MVVDFKAVAVLILGLVPLAAAHTYNTDIATSRFQ
jgi:hypothetical protein